MISNKSIITYKVTSIHNTSPRQWWVTLCKVTILTVLRSPGDKKKKHTKKKLSAPSEIQRVLVFIKRRAMDILWLTEVQEYTNEASEQK